MIPADGPVLLVTGATGFVGGSLLRRLLATRSDLRVIALVRRPDQVAGVTAVPRVSATVGDITIRRSRTT